MTTWTGIPPDYYTPRSGSWFDTKNRLVNAGLGTHCDAAGHQDMIGAYTFKYDGENRLKEITINSAAVTYAYDGEGRRVKRTAGGQTTVYVYNAMGELAAECGGETTGSGLQCLTADALGSTRLVTDAGDGVVSRLDYLPYGEEIPAGKGGRGPQWSAGAGSRRWIQSGSPRSGRWTRSGSIWMHMLAITRSDISSLTAWMSLSAGVRLVTLSKARVRCSGSCEKRTVRTCISFRATGRTAAGNQPSRLSHSQICLGQERSEMRSVQTRAPKRGGRPSGSLERLRETR